MAEPADPSDDQARRAEKEEHHRIAILKYNKEMRRRRAEDNAKLKGLQIGDIDKKLKSQLNLALGKEGQKCFSHKNPGKRILDINFAEFWELLKTTTRTRVFWNNTSSENQHDWERWSEKFQLTIIAKDSVDIEDVINPAVRTELVYPMAEPADPSEDQARRAEKEEHHRIAILNYNEEMRRRRAEDNAKFNGLQIEDIDKKLKSQLYLALGKEGQKCFSHKNPGKRILDINFAEFWEFLKTTFTVTTNLTYERVDPLAEDRKKTSLKEIPRNTIRIGKKL